MKNKIILAMLILSVVGLVFSGCGGGNPVTPPIPDNGDGEAVIEYTESTTNQEGIGTFTVSDGQLSVRVLDSETDEAIENIECYLSTDGTDAVILLVDPRGEYIPRLTSYQNEYPNKGMLWDSLGLFYMDLKIRFIEGGSHLVYLDEYLPEELTREILDQQYEHTKTTKFKNLGGIFRGSINAWIDSGIGFVETQVVSLALTPISGVGGALYEMYSDVRTIDEALESTMINEATERYENLGYEPDQKFEIWEAKWPSADFGSFLVLPCGPPKSSIPPTAYIDSIDPNPAQQGETVTFNGHGTDPDGKIMFYRWESNIDGLLSNLESFNRSDLSVGTHTISFKVFDTGANPSDVVSESLTITPATPETYTITASAGPNGSISPSGNVTVNQGSDKSFTITPNTGYSINDVLVDGISVGAVSSYTFTNVTEDHTISATFQETLHSDLVITDLYIKPDPPVAGGNYSIGVDIKNQGDENIEETFQVKVYFDDEYIKQFEIEGLGVGHMLRILTTSYFTWPSDTNSHTIKAIVDPNNIINESNENNNQYSNSFISTSITPASVIMEEFNGNTMGNSYGIVYTNTINGQGAVFSRVKESRIEYPFSMGFPHGGTIEYLIKVYSGYRYSDYVLHNNSDCARIFDTGSQDVWYPGAMWIDVCNDGTINLGTATTWAQPECHNLKAIGTDFAFNEWHTIGISFGSQGQYIMLDGNIVTANASYTESLRTCGNFTSAVNVPTVGELVSCFWVNNRYDTGFEGVIDRFRVSEKQKDWYLSKTLP